MKIYLSFILFIFLFSCQNRSANLIKKRETGENKNKISEKTKNSDTKISQNNEKNNEKNTKKVKPADKTESGKIDVKPVKSATPVSTVKKTVQKPEVTVIPSDPIKKAELYTDAGYGAFTAGMLAKLENQYKNNFKYWFLRGKAEYLIFKLKKSLSYFKKAEKLCSGSPCYETLIFEGRILNRLRKYQRSAKLMYKAVKLNSKDRRAWVILMNALEKLRRKTELKKVIFDAKNAIPSDPFILIKEADFYIMTKNRKKAEMIFESLKSDKNVKGFIRARVTDRLGLLYARYNRKKALALLKSCKKEFPSYGCVYTEMQLYPKRLAKPSPDEIKYPPSYGKNIK